MYARTWKGEGVGSKLLWFEITENMPRTPLANLNTPPPEKFFLASRMKCMFIKLARFNICIPQQTALTLRVLQCNCTLRDTGNIQNNIVCKPRIIFFKNDQCLSNYTKHGLCNILNDRESLSLPFLYCLNTKNITKCV